jgi:hypothetical protein
MPGGKAPGDALGQSLNSSNLMALRKASQILHMVRGRLAATGQKTGVLER